MLLFKIPSLLFIFFVTFFINMKCSKEYFSGVFTPNLEIGFNYAFQQVNDLYLRM